MNNQKDHVFVSRSSICTQDGVPIKSFPKKITMTIGNKYYCAQIGKESTEFFCADNFHSMKENEFELFIEQYKKFAIEIYGNLISEEHFLLKELPKKLKEDYEIFSDPESEIE